MINIRLQRRGRKNDPSFRVIVVDSHKKPKTGNYLEMVGSYDPRSDRVELKGERIKEWMKNGATGKRHRPQPPRFQQGYRRQEDKRPPEEECKEGRSGSRGSSTSSCTCAS
jgi:ribosomal protein S16